MSHRSDPKISGQALPAPFRYCTGPTRPAIISPRRSPHDHRTHQRAPQRPTDRPETVSGLVERYHELLFFRHPRARTLFPQDLRHFTEHVQPVFKTILHSLTDTAAMGPFVQVSARITDDPELLTAMGEALADALPKWTGP